jgi:GT2 family glycosyltransferase
MTSCTILILTYKGKHHLELLLPTVKAAIDSYKGDSRMDVMIVDNGSDEETREFSQSNYPTYKYLFSPVNDYLFSLNAFIKQIPTEFVFMLNDDMKLDKNVLNELIPLIQKDRGLFAVTCRIMDFDGTYTASAVRTIKYRKGWIYNHYLDPHENDVKYTLYPGGGAAIFRTSYFNLLEGFDSLYRPAYAEDLDLGTRAWQRNWRTIYHPKAILYHREGGTINNQFKKDKLEQTIFRNHILWMIKNGRYPAFIFWFFLKLPYRLVYNFLFNKNQYRALLHSFSNFGLAFRRRRVAVISVKNKEWIGLLNHTYIGANS